MKLKTVIITFTAIIIINCKSVPTLLVIDYQPQALQKKKPLSKDDLKNWQYKDIIDDTIPGISLDKAYTKLLKDKKGKEIVVAIIDTETDIDHKELKKAIWVNTNEIPNNNIDDDKNGYIDDIHGWNFLGNKKGENNRFVNFEYTRILKKYKPIFKGKKLEDIKVKDTSLFNIYNKAQEAYNKRMKYAVTKKENYDVTYNKYYQAKKTLLNYFPKENHTIKKIDSIKKTIKDSIQIDDLAFMYNIIKHNVKEQRVVKIKLQNDEEINKLLNVEYNDRVIQGDNPDDILDTHYGNNRMNANIDIFDHGTQMAGIIKNIGRRQEIKIMSLAIAAYGDEHDKDIALAIHYAVDNGAKVINMSFSKEFSLHPKWIEKAIKYAEKKGVLLISAAGNDAINLDDNSFFKFPNDHSYFNYDEVSDNYVKVGASTSKLNKKLKASYSNYGKREVDVFAPGKNIYTTLPNNRYTTKSNGTSSATAITSGLAALLFSYYPELTASQVKHLLMDSGVAYTFSVKVPTEDDKNKMMPFNQLSRSGKIINAYNAFIMAAKIAKKKK